MTGSEPLPDKAAAAPVARAAATIPKYFIVICAFFFVCEVANVIPSWMVYSKANEVSNCCMWRKGRGKQNVPRGLAHGLCSKPSVGLEDATGCSGSRRKGVRIALFLGSGMRMALLSSCVPKKNMKCCGSFLFLFPHNGGKPGSMMQYVVLAASGDYPRLRTPRKAGFLALTSCIIHTPSSTYCLKRTVY